MPLALAQIEGSQLSRYWEPKRKRQFVHYPKHIEEALASGRMAGFVVTEQTIQAEVPWSMLTRWGIIRMNAFWTYT